MKKSFKFLFTFCFMLLSVLFLTNTAYSATKSYNYKFDFPNEGVTWTFTPGGPAVKYKITSGKSVAKVFLKDGFIMIIPKKAGTVKVVMYNKNNDFIKGTFKFVKKSGKFNASTSSKINAKKYEIKYTLDADMSGNVFVTLTNATKKFLPNINLSFGGKDGKKVVISDRFHLHPNGRVCRILNSQDANLITSDLENADLYRISQDGGWGSVYSGKVTYSDLNYEISKDRKSITGSVTVKNPNKYDISFSGAVVLRDSNNYAILSSWIGSFLRAGESKTYDLFGNCIIDEYPDVASCDVIIENGMLNK